MKKILGSLLIVAIFSCNGSVNKIKGEKDSTTVTDQNALSNDVPMRTTDTNTNIMKDTLGIKKDTTKR